MKMKIKILFFTSILAIPVFANEEILKTFEDMAKKSDSHFKVFSIANGENFYRTERVNSKGEKVSCMTCHTTDPKAEGKTRANKIIDPLAPVANKERFTDMAKVEKWFKRNCKDVYDRECTVLEKGNFTKFMMSIK